MEKGGTLHVQFCIVVDVGKACFIPGVIQDDLVAGVWVHDWGLTSCRFLSCAVISVNSKARMGSSQAGGKRDVTRVNHLLSQHQPRLVRHPPRSSHQPIPCQNLPDLISVFHAAPPTLTPLQTTCSRNHITISRVHTNGAGCSKMKSTTWQRCCPQCGGHITELVAVMDTQWSFRWVE